MAIHEADIYLESKGGHITAEGHSGAVISAAIPKSNSCFRFKAISEIIRLKRME